MKKIRLAGLLIFLILIGVMTSGCFKKQDKKMSGVSTTSMAESETVSTSSGVSSSHISSTAISSSSSSSTETAKGSSNENSCSSSASTDASKSFYGSWKISNHFVYGLGAGTYSDDSVKKVIGKELIITSKKATCFGEDVSCMDHSISNPDYKETTLSDSDMYEGWRITFKMLGIENSSILQVIAQDQTGNCTFFVLNHDRLILTGGGEFFYLDRVG